MVLLVALAPLACLARFEVGDSSAGSSESSAGESSGAEVGLSGSESSGSADSTGSTGSAETDGGSECEEPCEPTLEQCVEGSCVCRFELTPCGGQCVDLDSDPLNCGGCGTDCEGEVCDDGECVSECQGEGKAECAGACVNLEQDPLHCGECSESCAADELCVESACVLYFAADCETDLDCPAGVCCEVEGLSDSFCLDGDQCP